MKSILRTLVFVTSLFSLIALAGPVNVNSADAETLASAIKGIGLVKAQAIVDHRNQHGPYQSVEELTQVKGIGSKTIEKNRDQLTVGE